MRLHLCIALLGLIQSAFSEVSEGGNLVSLNPTSLHSLIDETVTEFAAEPLTFPAFNNGGLIIKNGRVFGLSKMKRTGDCFMIPSGVNLRAECSVGVDDVRLKVNFNWEGWTGKLEAKVPSIETKITIIATKSDVNLQSFVVTHLGTMKVTSLSVDGFFGSFVEKDAINLNDYRNDIIAVIEMEGTKKIRDKIPSLARKLTTTPFDKHDEF